MTENINTENCIRTFTGVYFNVFDPKPDMVNITDIAHALSNQCRFAGHLPKFYSVAQHSVHCVEVLYHKHSLARSHALATLLHDASEAYLTDVPRPVKHKLTNYIEIEHNLMCVIAEVFGFEYPFHPFIKEVDDYMLQQEWDNLMIKRRGTGFPAHCFTPEESERLFLARFKSIKKQRSWANTNA